MFFDSTTVVSVVSELGFSIGSDLRDLKLVSGQRNLHIGSTSAGERWGVTPSELRGAVMKLLLVVLLVVLPAEAQVAWPASGPELCTVPTTLPIRPTSTCSDFGNGASCEVIQRIVQ